MVEKKVNICDVCNKEIAEKTCEICDRDVCKSCQEDISIGLAGGGEIIHIISCSTCSRKLKLGRVKSVFDNNSNSDLRKKIVKNLKNAASLETLERDEDDFQQRKKRIFGGSVTGGQPPYSINDIWKTNDPYKKKKSFFSKFKLGGQAK